MRLVRFDALQEHRLSFPFASPPSYSLSLAFDKIRVYVKLLSVDV